MPSFDVVSKVDLAEVDNALENVRREMAGRFDFKGAKATVERDDLAITLLADDDTRLAQMQEMLRVHLTRRKVDPGSFEFKDAERAGGDMRRQAIAIRQGIPADLAKRIVKDLKGSKLKVQAQIQGDELRVTGKSRDELQGAIAFLRGLKLDQPLQYQNFRD